MADVLKRLAGAVMALVVTLAWVTFFVELLGPNSTPEHRMAARIAAVSLVLWGALVLWGIYVATRSPK